MFIRVGRGLLINSNFIYVININKQELILANTSSPVKYTLHVSKEALRGLKSLMMYTFWEAKGKHLIEKKQYTY